MSVETRAILYLLCAQVGEERAKGIDVDAMWFERSAWTTFMVGDSVTRKSGDFGVLGRIGKRLGYTPQAEYLRLDQIWYWTLGGGDYDWEIDAYLEHENDIKRLPETVRKLMQLDQGTKVIVTYPARRSITEEARDIASLLQGRFGLDPNRRVSIVSGELRGKEIYWEARELDGRGNTQEIRLPEKER